MQRFWVAHGEQYWSIAHSCSNTVFAALCLCKRWAVQWRMWARIRMPCVPYPGPARRARDHRAQQQLLDVRWLVVGAGACALAASRGVYAVCSGRVMFPCDGHLRVPCNRDAASQQAQPARKVAGAEQPKLPKCTNQSMDAPTSHCRHTRKGTAKQRAEHSTNEPPDKPTTVCEAAAGRHSQQRTFTHHSPSSSSHEGAEQRRRRSRPGWRSTKPDTEVSIRHWHLFITRYNSTSLLQHTIDELPRGKCSQAGLTGRSHGHACHSSHGHAKGGEFQGMQTPQLSGLWPRGLATVWSVA